MLVGHRVLPKLTTVRNPQSNGVHKRMYLILRKMLRMQEIYMPEQSISKSEINTSENKINL